MTAFVADGRTATRRPTLDADEAHVWWLGVGGSDRANDHVRRCLSPDEVARAGRFVRGSDGRRYADTRGALRLILGGYLGVDPGKLAFQTNEFGKPELTEPLSGEHIEFNVSHSDSLALIGVSVGRRIGVDLERIRFDTSLEQVAAYFLSATEQAALSALSPEARTRAFFDVWVRKEAYVKGRGEGLSLPLQRFSVSLHPEGPAMIANSIHPEDVSRWSLYDLGPAGDYAAAAAVEGDIERIRSFDMRWPHGSG